MNVIYYYKCDFLSSYLSYLAKAALLSFFQINLPVSLSQLKKINRSNIWMINNPMKKLMQIQYIINLSLFFTRSNRINQKSISCQINNESESRNKNIAVISMTQCLKRARREKSREAPIKALEMGTEKAAPATGAGAGAGAV